MKERLWLKLAVIGFALLAVSGCGRRESSVVPNDVGVRRNLRILVVGDPFALALDRTRPALEAAIGRPIELEIVGYNDNHQLLLQLTRDRQAAYDVVSFDVVWLGELVQKGILSVLPPDVLPPAKDFLAGSLATCQINGQTYGLPIQPHSELLWVRRDWFEAAGLAFPETTDELLAAARHFHRPEEGRYGIAWNAQRGQPLGQSMAHFFAAFGQPLLDEHDLPAFKTERGLRAAQFVLALRDVSPPDILNMAWDQRVSRFATGTVAMTYGWGARAFMAERDPVSRVRGLVRYGPPPHAPDTPPVIPLGVWALGIPSNVPSPDESVLLLRHIGSPALLKLMVQHGHGAPPLLSLLADPELQRDNPVFSTMLDAQKTHVFSAAMRPSVPEWADLCEILGTVFHDMLRKELTPEEALAKADREARQLLGRNSAR